MTDEVQVKASVSRALKCKAFAALALKDQKFKQWLEHELAALVNASPELAAQRRDPQEPKNAVEAMAR
jgi:hypothetical protein